MHDTLPSAPAHHDVRAALLWALEHDRKALLEHREATQRCIWAAARGAADRLLVRRWLVATTHEPAPIVA
jgi:hypothetical protein